MKEFVRLTLDDPSAPGVYDTTPAVGGQIFVVLTKSNSSTVRKHMAEVPIRSAGYTNRRTRKEGRSYTVSGKLTTEMKPSQGGFFFGASGILTGLSAGNCPQLPSFTYDHGFFLDDGTCAPVLARYLGCKASGSIGASADSEDMMIDLDILGMTAATITNTDLPTPTSSLIPDFETPFGFQDSSGLILWGTGGGYGIRTKYTSFSLGIKNILAPLRTESSHVGQIDWKGRDVNLTLNNLYARPQDRADYEALTARSASLGLAFNGYTIGFNLGGNCQMSEPQDDLAIDKQFMQSITIESYIDQSTGNDLTVTWTPPV